MFYTIYKITNKINGKIYIGKHQTKNLDDGYMGSGKILCNSIKKYGIENFDKEILFIFETETEMNAKEAEIVTQDFCLLGDNYNLCPGGQGGFGYIRNMETYPEQVVIGRKNANIKIKQIYGVDNISQTENFKAQQSARTKLMWEQGVFKNVDTKNFLGKKHSPETKLKISMKAKERLKTPENNSQYGKMWIHSVELKKSIKIDKSSEIPLGWVKGRKMKFD